MGEQKMQAQLIADGETLTGTMQDANQPAMAIKEGSIKGNHLGWKFDLKKPIALTVTFTLKLDGDAMTGTGKAGMFPPAPVSATRARTGV
jgi:hypothetical protein